MHLLKFLKHRVKNKDFLKTLFFHFLYRKIYLLQTEHFGN